MRILRASDGVNTMVCDDQGIVLGLLNKTIEVYNRQSLKRVNDHGPFKNLSFYESMMRDTLANNHSLMN